MSADPSRGRARGRLFSNTRDLLLLQAANYLIPLVLLTHLTRTLGLELFGVYALAIAAAQIVFVFTDYGFSLSGAYSLSRRRNRLAFSRRFIGAALQIKLVIITLCAVVFAAIATFQTKYHDHQTYLLLMILPMAAEAFVPFWIFQGLEKFRVITTATVISRAGYAAVVFLFVRSADQFLLLPLLLTASHCGSLFIGWRALIRLGYTPASPDRRFTLQVFRSGWGYFLSRLAVAMYSSVGSVFLGVTQSATQVAIFSSAQQLYRAMQGVIGMASQALYPYMVRERDFALLRVATLAAAGAGILGVAFVYLFGEFFIHLIFGEAFGEAYFVLRVLTAAFAIYGISIFMGYPLFGAIGRPEIANKSTVVAGVAQLGFLAIAYVTGNSTAINVAETILAAEAVVLVLRLFWAIPHLTEITGKRRA